MSGIAAGTVVGAYVVRDLVRQMGDFDLYEVKHRKKATTHVFMVARDLDLYLRERILLAGRLQTTLRHSNLVAVTDVVDVEGTPVLVADRVAGPKLAELISEERPSIALAHGLMCGILRGTVAIHQRQVVHRNLTPENILVDESFAEPAPRITNFVMAKIGASAPKMTVSGMALGTPQYMAPEQIRDSTSVDGRADVFALGAIAYELLSGVRAFERSDVVATFRAIARGVYPPLPGDVPTELAAIVAAALESDHNQRLSSAEAFLERWTAAYESFGNAPTTTPAKAPDDELSPDDIPTEEDAPPPRKRSWWPWS